MIVNNNNLSKNHLLRDRRREALFLAEFLLPWITYSDSLAIDCCKIYSIYTPVSEGRRIVDYDDLSGIAGKLSSAFEGSKCLGGSGF